MAAYAEQEVLEARECGAWAAAWLRLHDPPCPHTNSHSPASLAGAAPRAANCSSQECLSLCSRCRSAYFCSLKCQRVRVLAPLSCRVAVKLCGGPDAVTALPPLRSPSPGVLAVP